jgi:inorganic pyrophosphatase
MPGLLAATTEWFRIYKVPDGKPENQFAFGGQAKDKSYALGVIQETHEAWRKLVSGQVPNKTDKYDIKTENTSVADSKYRVDSGSEVYRSVPPALAQPTVNPIEPAGKFLLITTIYFL